MTTASDTPQERIAEYKRLFEHALVGRERTPAAVVWRFTPHAGVEAWVRDLSQREAACCPFLNYTVSVQDGLVIYEIAAGNDPAVQTMLDVIHRLPEEVADGFSGLLQQLEQAGFDIKTSDGGKVTTATAASATRRRGTRGLGSARGRITPPAVSHL